MLLAALLAWNPLPVSAATSDPVLDWIGIMNTTVLAGNTNPLVTTRVVALVSASVFDAVNGIEPRFQPLHALRGMMRSIRLHDRPFSCLAASNAPAFAFPTNHFDP